MPKARSRPLLPRVRRTHAAGPSASGRVPESEPDLAGALLALIDASPTAFHAVQAAKGRLETAGFEPLLEGDDWALQPGDRRYVVKQGSTIIAFIVGSGVPAEAGFRMIGAHTDSPNLRLKPRAGFTKHGYRQLGVEVYGGVLLSTWLDRDLSIAGRVAIRTRRGPQLRLVDLGRPLVRVPNLAIHLNREVNREGLKLNPQTHLAPILALEPKSTKKGKEQDPLLALLSEALQVEAEAITSHDLSLYDVQKGARSGPSGEFIQVARLDNLASCYSAIAALTAGAGTTGAATKLIALYDHEEVGSRSAQGAGGPFLEQVLGRIIEAVRPERQAFARAMANSLFISADMAHAVHPNYADKHEPQHLPAFGLGPVIKTNTGQSYATDGETDALFVELCREAGFSPQRFVSRGDVACGSTIGPITAARLGAKTLDIGNPMLSMHSIREMAAAADLDLMHRVLVRHFAHA